MNWLIIIGTNALTFLLTLIGSLLIDPYFSYVADEKKIEIVEDFETVPFRVSFTVFPIFKNLGFKPGHIEDVKFSPVELHAYPDSVKLNGCDQAPISVLSVFSGKITRCQFVMTFDPNKAIKLKDQMYFQAAYYGPGGLGCCWFGGHPLTLIRPSFRTPWD